jgi:hypothetical protein
MKCTPEDQERHLLVKVIGHILHKLICSCVHKILVVVESLFIDEGREIISNLPRAPSLVHTISAMRPDIDHADRGEMTIIPPRDEGFITVATS